MTLEQLCAEFFGTTKPDEIMEMMNGLNFGEVKREALQEWCEQTDTLLVSRVAFHQLCWRSKVQVYDEEDRTNVTLKDFG